MGKRYPCVRAYRKAAKRGVNPTIMLRKINRHLKAKSYLPETGFDPRQADNHQKTKEPRK